MTFEDYIEDQGFERITDDMFECPGGHIWHTEDIRNEFLSRPQPDQGE